MNDSSEQKNRDQEMKNFIAGFSALPIHFWKEEDIRTLGHFFDRWFYASGASRWWNGVVLGLTMRCLLRANEMIG